MPTETESKPTTPEAQVPELDADELEAELVDITGALNTAKRKLNRAKTDGDKTKYQAQIAECEADLKAVQEDVIELADTDPDWNPKRHTKDYFMGAVRAAGRNGAATAGAAVVLDACKKASVSVAMMANDNSVLTMTSVVQYRITGPGKLQAIKQTFRVNPTVKKTAKTAKASTATAG